MGLSLGTMRPTKAHGNLFHRPGGLLFQCSPSLELTAANQFATQNLSSTLECASHITRAPRQE